MNKAVFPGSFDPPTLGHLNLIQRASELFGSLDVVIAHNSEKQSYLELDQRKSLMEYMVKESGCSNVRVVTCESLIVDYCHSNGIKVIVRGLRALSDFGYEFELAMINKHLDHSVETVFLPTDPEFFVLRSSMVKELVKLGGDLSGMVHPKVEEVLKKNLSDNELSY